jgi:hypothetical protein
VGAGYWNLRKAQFVNVIIAEVERDGRRQNTVHPNKKCYVIHNNHCYENFNLILPY